MRRSSTRLAGAALVAAGLAAAMLGTGRTSGGPLGEDVPPNAVTFSVTAGVAFTYGGLQLRNAGTDAARLEGVRLVGASRGLRVESARVLPLAQADGGLWFSYETYPPPGLPEKLLQPLGGYRLAPDAGEAQVLLALMVADEGTYQFRELAVQYQAQGRRFEATFPFAMRVCAPMVDLGECPALPAEH